LINLTVDLNFGQSNVLKNSDFTSRLKFIPSLCYIERNVQFLPRKGGEHEMVFYCVKCRAKKEVSEGDYEEGVAKNGRPYVKGKCPDCGTTMFKFVAAK